MQYTRYFLFLLRTFCLQLVLCQVFRTIFILVSPAKFDFNLFFGSLISGLKFDLGISLAILVLVVFFNFVLSFLKQNRSFVFIILLNLLILLQATVSVGDVILYKYWDSIFSVRAYPYFKNISELTRNVSLFNLIFVAFYFGFICFIVHNGIKILNLNLESKTKRHIHIVFILVLLPLTFFIMRGGLREIPRNQSDGFFCDHRTYNIASINSTWNFFNVLVENQKFLDLNPYKKLSDSHMMSRISEIQKQGINHELNLFNFSSNPNIVLITMEGVSAEIFKIHNGDSSYMPFLESLLDSSYYFMRAYSVGSRTEQGLGAMLTGSLATPYNNVTDNVSTLSDLPSILTSMKERRYHKRFVFGGNIEFANMRAYLKEIGFDTILDINFFSNDLHKQSLGVPDEYLFHELAIQYRKMKVPFFLQTLTLSTHEPFDVPRLKTFASEKKMYLQSVHYLDKQLEFFFKQIRGDKKYDNTLFIITSDHSHKMPYDFDIAAKERYHIPVIFYTSRLNPIYKGYKDSTLFAQHNLPATLSYLLNWKEKNYLKFSRNHFSNMDHYTMSAFVNGYLYQTDTSSISYDYVWRPYDTTNQELVKQHSYPQAILQYLADQIRGARSLKEK